MIYDTFMYSGEDDILLIRLNELWTTVDKFIILESPLSHTKIFKNLEFLRTKSQFEKFEQFLPKIDYYNHNYCTNENPFFNDFAGRQILSHIVQTRYKLSGSDIVLHGDLDEVPNLQTLKSCFPSDHKKTLVMRNRVLCIDLESEENFFGTMILNLTDLRNNHLHELRNKRQSLQEILFELVDDGGWHFTYCGGVDKVIKKLNYFAHASECPEKVKHEKFILDCVKNGETLTHNKLEKIELHTNKYPSDLINFPNKYKKMLSNHYE